MPQSRNKYRINKTPLISSSPQKIVFGFITMGVFIILENGEDIRFGCRSLINIDVLLIENKMACSWGKWRGHQVWVPIMN
jgi:hypothetical protein